MKYKIIVLLVVFSLFLILIYCSDNKKNEVENTNFIKKNLSKKVLVLEPQSPYKNVYVIEPKTDKVIKKIEFDRRITVHQWTENQSNFFYLNDGLYVGSFSDKFGIFVLNIKNGKYDEIKIDDTIGYANIIDGKLIFNGVSLKDYGMTLWVVDPLKRKVLYSSPNIDLSNSKKGYNQLHSISYDNDNIYAGSRNLITGQSIVVSINKEDYKIKNLFESPERNDDNSFNYYYTPIVTNEYLYIFKTKSNEKPWGETLLVKYNKINLKKNAEKKIFKDYNPLNVMFMYKDETNTNIIYIVLGEAFKSGENGGPGKAYLIKYDLEKMKQIDSVLISTKVPLYPQFYGYSNGKIYLEDIINPDSESIICYKISDFDKYKKINLKK